MRVTFFAFFTVLFFAALLVTSSAASMSSDDFIRQATIGSQFEIQSSQYAQQASQNAAVKELAQQMIDDHTAAANSMKEIIANSDVKMPMPSPKLDPKHRDTLKKLRNSTPAKLDQKYIDEQLAAHHEAIALFTNYAQGGDNADLKNFAAQTLPTLQQHLEHTQQIKAELK